jgi:hypothetical protein
VSLWLLAPVILIQIPSKAHGFPAYFGFLEHIGCLSALTSQSVRPKSSFLGVPVLQIPPSLPWPGLAPWNSRPSIASLRAFL